MIITISHLGYIKRTPLSDFKTQGRGGVGSRGGVTRDEDFIEHMFVASMHSTLLLFTKMGKCYWMKVYQVPEGSRISKGRAIQNVLNISGEDRVLAYIRVKTLDDQEFIDNNFIILATKKGIIKKTTLEAYSRPRANGVNAITIKEDDELLEARRTSGNHEIMLAVRSGKAIRFNEKIVRPIGRTASGVKGVTLGNETDEVVGMICVNDPEDDVLVVSEHGYGKRSSLSDYPITNRGGKGVKTINITEKTGKLIAIKNVSDENDLMIITQNGLTIRIAVKTIRVMGRAAQGVRIINLKDQDQIASVVKVRHYESEEEEKNEEKETDQNDVNQNEQEN